MQSFKRCYKSLKLDTLLLCRYTWIGACNETGDIVFDIVDPYLDSDGRSAVWALSTPHYCLDYFVCQVTNIVNGNRGSASMLVEDTSGKKYQVHARVHNKI